MGDGDLAHRLDALLEERTALAEELFHLAAHIHEIRRIVGNPFAYSHPAHPDEGATHYTGGSSHEVILPTLQRLRRVDAEISELQSRLNS